MADIFVNINNSYVTTGTGMIGNQYNWNQFLVDIKDVANPGDITYKLAGTRTIDTELSLYSGSSLYFTNIDAQSITDPWRINSTYDEDSHIFTIGRSPVSNLYEIPNIANGIIEAHLINISPTTPQEIRSEYTFKNLYIKARTYQMSIGGANAAFYKGCTFISPYIALYSNGSSLQNFENCVLYVTPPTTESPDHYIQLYGDYGVIGSYFNGCVFSGTVLYQEFAEFSNCQFDWIPSYLPDVNSGKSSFSEQKVASDGSLNDIEVLSTINHTAFPIFKDDCNSADINENWTIGGIPLFMQQDNRYYLDDFDVVDGSTNYIEYNNYLNHTISSIKATLGFTCNTHTDSAPVVISAILAAIGVDNTGGPTFFIIYERPTFAQTLIRLAFSDQVGTQYTEIIKTINTGSGDDPLGYTDSMNVELLKNGSNIELWINNIFKATVSGSFGANPTITIGTGANTSELNNLVGWVDNIVIKGGDIDFLGYDYGLFGEVKRTQTHGIGAFWFGISRLSITISPNSGSALDPIDIFTLPGSENFDIVLSNNIIQFGNEIFVPASAYISASNIRVIIPSNAVSSFLRVSTPLNISNSVYIIINYADIKFQTTEKPKGKFDSGPNRSAIYNRDLSISNFSEIVDENSIIQNVYNIILTRPGERYFNTNFGCEIHNKVFELIDGSDADEKEILNILEQSISQFEPRAVIIREESKVTLKSDGNAVLILLTIRVPSGSVRQIGLSIGSVRNVT